MRTPIVTRGIVVRQPQPTILRSRHIQHLSTRELADNFPETKISKSNFLASILLLTYCGLVDYDGTKLDTAIDYADITELADDSEADNASQNECEKAGDTTDYDADDDEPGWCFSTYLLIFITVLVPKLSRAATKLNYSPNFLLSLVFI